tara:strand:+ start:1343 stop:2125 length:783 start_codon:yes stop_codon:yes gene_type:complete
MENYLFTKCCIGTGKFSKVYLSKNKNNLKKILAVKIMDKNNLDEFNFDAANEINIHSKLVHKNIVKFIETQKDVNKIYIFLEYAVLGNSHEYRMDNKTKFTEEFATSVISDISLALEYIHGENIVHGDIKPENILIFEEDGKKIAKLADFGWASECKEEGLTRLVGTLEFLAPEIVELKQYKFPVDMWSLGIVFYEYINNVTPFYTSAYKGIYAKIKKCEYEIPKNVSSNSCEIISFLLVKDPEKRYTAKQLNDFLLMNL